MKNKTLASFGLAIGIALSSCATVNMTSGHDFDTSKVAQIVKSKTTATEMVAWFGVPPQKSAGMDGNETWGWGFTHTSSHAQSYLISMDVRTQTEGKKLTATLRDGVVQSFAFSEGPMSPWIP